MACAATLTSLVYGSVSATVVLCPECGAIVPAPPTIKRRQYGDVYEVSRLGTTFAVPAHERRDPGAIILRGDYLDDHTEGRFFLDADPLTPAQLDDLFVQILDEA